MKKTCAWALLCLALLCGPLAQARRRPFQPKEVFPSVEAQSLAVTPKALPVFFFHGVTSNNRSGLHFHQNLTAEGRAVVSLSFCMDDCSVRSLNQQIPLAIEQIRSVVRQDRRFAHGYVFIGHSQGGALARAVIEHMDDHRVRTFISLAGVVNGVFYGPQPADRAALDKYLAGFGQILVPVSVFNISRYTAEQTHGQFQSEYDAFASQHTELQDQFSYFNLARSPDQTPWTRTNTFLPVLNNINDCEAQAACLEQQRRRRRNFLRLHAAHFFASPDDGVVAPWQSSVLGQYSMVDSEEAIETSFQSLHVLDMTQTAEFQQDTYGLRSLEMRGALFRHVVPNVAHSCWVADTHGHEPCSFWATYDRHIYPILRQS